MNNDITQVLLEIRQELKTLKEEVHGLKSGGGAGQYNAPPATQQPATGEGDQPSDPIVVSQPEPAMLEETLSFGAPPAATDASAAVSETPADALDNKASDVDAFALPSFDEPKPETPAGSHAAMGETNPRDIGALDLPDPGVAQTDTGGQETTFATKESAADASFDLPDLDSLAAPPPPPPAVQPEAAQEQAVASEPELPPMPDLGALQPTPAPTSNPQDAGLQKSEPHNMQQPSFADPAPPPPAPNLGAPTAPPTSSAAPQPSPDSFATGDNTTASAAPTMTYQQPTAADNNLPSAPNASFTPPNVPAPADRTPRIDESVQAIDVFAVAAGVLEGNVTKLSPEDRSVEQQMALAELEEMSSSALAVEAQAKRRGGFFAKRRDGIELPELASHFPPGKPLITVFFSQKGGVGKSTQALNYATGAALAAIKNHKQDQVRVLLIDGDVANGDLGFRLSRDTKVTPNLYHFMRELETKLIGSLGLKPEVITRTKATEWIGPKRDELDRILRALSPEEDLLPYLHSNILDAPNLFALYSLVNHPEMIQRVRPLHLLLLMGLASKYFQVITIDSGPHVTEHTNLFWLWVSDQIHWLVEPEIACLHGAISNIIALKEAQVIVSTNKVRVICIKANAKIGEETAVLREITIDTFASLGISEDRIFFIGNYNDEAIKSHNSHTALLLRSPDYSAEISAIITASMEAYEREVMRAAA